MADQQGAFSEIPVIDVGPMWDNSGVGLEQVAQDIDYAYSQVGFAYIINHGIEQALIDGIFTASRQFHALPHEVKIKIKINEFHCGFIPLKTSTGKTSTTATVTKPNQSESFMIMHELPDDDSDVLDGASLVSPNQWPESLPEFRPMVQAYNTALTNLAHILRQAISVALGARRHELDLYFEYPTIFLRMLYYPPQPRQSPDDLYGCAPHTDYGFITILLQDDVGGLQVCNVQGEWIDVPYLPGTFVMNSADILHRWSNGRFISTRHRVINRSGRARYSNAFFYEPDMKAEIIPLSSCVTPDNPPRYEPVVYGDYLMARLHANHTQHEKRTKI